MVTILIISGGSAAHTAHHLRLVGEDGRVPPIIHLDADEFREVPLESFAVDELSVVQREVLDESDGCVGYVRDNGDFYLPPDFPLDAELLRPPEMRVVLTTPINLGEVRLPPRDPKSFWEAHREPHTRPPKASNRLLKARRK